MAPRHQAVNRYFFAPSPEILTTEKQGMETITES